MTTQKAESDVDTTPTQAMAEAAERGLCDA